MRNMAPTLRRVCKVLLCSSSFLSPKNAWSRSSQKRLAMCGAARGWQCVMLLFICIT